jgi:hypothetical protein
MIEGREGGEKMSKKVLAADLVLLCLAMGYNPLARAEAPGKGVPVITQSFASPKVWPGQTWKVYLNISDPNGEMKYIFATVEQPGVGPYPLSIIRIREGDRKEMSGYLYLVTATPWYSLDFVNLTLIVEVQDKSGNFSQPAIFPLAINSRYTQESAPGGVFKEQELGPVMVRLGTIGG